MSREPEHIRRGQLTADGRLLAAVSKTPPQNIELEMCVLGGIMLEPQDAYEAAADILHPESFYLDGHATIFKLMGELAARGIPPDQKMVLDELRSRNLLDTVGGAGVLLSMINSVASAASVEYHCKKIADKAMKRALIRAATQVIEECYRQEMPLPEILDQVYQVSVQLAGDCVTDDGAAAADGVAEYWGELEGRIAEVEALKAQGKPAYIQRGLRTGWPNLDGVLRGLRPGQMVTVAAASSMGKTAFAIQLAWHVATKYHTPVAFFSLEMARDEIIERLLSLGSLASHPGGGRLTVPSHRLDVPNLTPSELRALEASRMRLTDAPLRLHCPGNLSVAALRATLRREIREHGVKLVIVDQLGNMHSTLPDPAGTVAQVSQLAKDLKATAREMRVPLVVVHQLSRVVAGRANKRPLLSDLRDSGQVENNSDVVLGVYREDYYRHGQPRLDTGRSDLPPAEIHVLKQRNGPTGQVDMHWLAEITRFLPVSEV